MTEKERFSKVSLCVFVSLWLNLFYSQLKAKGMPLKVFFKEQMNKHNKSGLYLIENITLQGL